MRPAERRAGATQRPPHGPSKPAGASRETWLALMASEPAPAGSEPRYSLPSGDRSMYSSDEGLT